MSRLLRVWLGCWPGECNLLAASKQEDKECLLILPGRIDLTGLNQSVTDRIESRQTLSLTNIYLP